MAPIHACAEMGNLSEVMRLVDRRVDSVHAKNFKGRTPLLVSALHGHLELVRYLLRCGSAIEARDEDSSTALMLASAHGRLCVICELLSEGASARVTDRWGRTPVTLAAEHGHLEVVHRLLELGADACDVNARGFGDGTTCLWMAALSDYDEVVRVLLEAGADPTVADAEGRTPLDIAIEEGCTNCARLLQEWQRVYVLTKACKLHDAYMSITTTAATNHTFNTDIVTLNSSSSSTTNSTDNRKRSTSTSTSTNKGDIHPPVPPWLRTRTNTRVHTSASSPPSTVASKDLPIVYAGVGVRRCHHPLLYAYELPHVQHRGESLQQQQQQQQRSHHDRHDHSPQGQQRCQHHHLPDPYADPHHFHHRHNVTLHTHNNENDEVSRDDNTCHSIPHTDDCSPIPLRGMGHEVGGAFEAYMSSQADNGCGGGVEYGSGQCYGHGCVSDYERVKRGTCACACGSDCAGDCANGCPSGFESGCDEERQGSRVGCVVAHVVREFKPELLVELLDMMRKAPGW